MIIYEENSQKNKPCNILLSILNIQTMLIGEIMIIINIFVTTQFHRY